jgi:hypothetical protein
VGTPRRSEHGRRMREAGGAPGRPGLAGWPTRKAVAASAAASPVPLVLQTRAKQAILSADISSYSGKGAKNDEAAKVFPRGEILF